MRKRKLWFAMSAVYCFQITAAPVAVRAEAAAEDQCLAYAVEKTGSEDPDELWKQQEKYHSEETGHQREEVVSDKTADGKEDDLTDKEGLPAPEEPEAPETTVPEVPETTVPEDPEDEPGQMPVEPETSVLEEPADGREQIPAEPEKQEAEQTPNEPKQESVSQETGKAVTPVNEQQGQLRDPEANMQRQEEMIPPVCPVEILPKSPEIRFMNLGPATASRGKLSPEIIITDVTLQQGKVEVLLTDENGRMIAAVPELRQEGNRLFCTIDEISRDGRYTLLVRGENGYGAGAEKKCTFTVNRNGTAFTALSDGGETKPEGFIPAVRMQNPDHIRIISCMLNGREVDYFWDGELLRIDHSEVLSGKNTVTLETKDGAGNVSSMEPWEFYIQADDQEKEVLETEPKIKQEKVSWLKKISELLLYLLKIVLSV